MDTVQNPERARFLRQTLALVGATAFGRNASSQEPERRPAMNLRTIRSTGQTLPVIGCGTWVGFDVAEGTLEFDALREVVRTLLAGGGTVLDSSPMYGRSEATTGRILADQPGKAFVATKVWTSGREAGIRQMEKSIELLGKVDLMQVHNLLDWKTHLPTLRQWKAEGRIRYIGVSHYTPGAYRELEAVLRAETLDFVQVNYAMDDREAENRILPLAADRGIAVLVNRPFGGGGLLKRLGNRPLPDWARIVGVTSWSQLLLKFVLSHPAVTCAIPGTGNPRHMAENVEAGTGTFPDPGFWKARIDGILA